MKNYLFFSTLSFILISLLIEMSMSSQIGFLIFTKFNWFLSPNLFSIDHFFTWIIQGIALSLAAYLYIHVRTALVDGFRFGLITGLLFTLVVLFNMLINVDQSIYTFYADSLLPLITLQLMGFALNGWIFGLMFEVFSPKQPNHMSLWSLA